MQPVPQEDRQWDEQQVVAEHVSDHAEVKESSGCPAVRDDQRETTRGISGGRGGSEPQNPAGNREGDSDKRANCRHSLERLLRHLAMGTELWANPFSPEDRGPDTTLVAARRRTNEPTSWCTL